MVIAQRPNLPLVVGVTSWALSVLAPAGRLTGIADLVAYGALFSWAWLELVSGVNYFRRALGLVMMVVFVYSRL